MNRYNNVMRQDCPVPPGTRVKAYVRDSGHEDQERSVAQQSEVIREYCNMHRLVLDSIYADDARKSTNTEKRDALNGLMADIRMEFPTQHDRWKREREQRKFHLAVILWKSNRLGRDAVESNYLTADLQMRAVTVFSLSNSMETGDAALDGILASVQRMHDQRTIDDISSDSKRGLAQLVGTRDTDMSFITHNPNWPTRDGRYLGIMPGPPPTGFTVETVVIGTNRRGEKREVQRLIPDPVKWEAAKLAWSLRAAGANIKTIHTATRLFKTVNSYTTFFRNRIYSGDLDYGGNRYVDFVPAMISREVYEAEQGRIRSRKEVLPASEHPRSRGSRHLLSGLLKCGYIDGIEHPMNADTISPRNGRAAWDFYMCATRKRTRNDKCGLPRINAKAINQAVIDFLMNEVLTFENLKSVSVSMSRALLDEGNNAKVELATLERKLQETQRAINNLTDIIERSGGSDAIAERLRKREGELRSLSGDLVVLQQRVRDAEVLSLPTDARITEWLVFTREGLVSRDIETARIIVRSLVVKVLITGKQKAVLYYAPPFVQPMTRLENVTHTGDFPYPIQSKELIIPYQEMTRSLSAAAIAVRRDARRMRASGMTYKEIGRALGVTLEMARQYVNDDRLDDKLA